MNLFKKLFGSSKKQDELNKNEPSVEETIPVKPELKTNKKTKNETEILTRYRQMYKGQTLKELNDQYFVILEKLLEADKKGNIDELISHIHASLGLLDSLIKFNKKEYGSFDIKTIPALEKGLIYFAINGNIGQLKNIKDLVESLQDLHDYKEKVDLAFTRQKLASKIYKYVKENPGCFQNKLKKNIDFQDGRLISTTVNYMVKADKLTKDKINNKILLNVK